MDIKKNDPEIFQEIRPRTFYWRQVDKTVRKPLLQCGAHVHEDIEIIILDAGQAIACIDTIKTTMNSGDIFFAFPNQLHSFRTIDPAEEHTLFIVKTELLPEYRELFLSSTPKSPIIRNAKSLPRVEKLVQMLVESERERDVSLDQANKRRCGYLLALVSELLLHMDITFDRTEDSRSILAVRNYCAEHFSQRISLPDVAQALSLNKFYLSHLFTEKLGVHFNDYINDLRISEACRLLLNTTESITQIGESVGFAAIRTFNRAFYKKMGSSPSEYRKRKGDSIQILHFTTANTSRIIESADKVIKQ